jgi:hypothetical protein
MLRATLLLSLIFALPGCVVWEIRDEMRGVNTRLDKVESTLQTVDAGLTTVNDELTDIEVQLGDVRGTIDNTNEYLDSVYGGLDDTNTSLGDMQERLLLLRSVQTSLTNIDAHLASLRKTINRIDGAIPFLSLGGDEVVETPAEPAPASDAAIAQDDAVEGGSASVEARQQADATAATPAPPVRQRPDPLVGVWISAQPSDGTTLVIQPGESYLLTRPIDDDNDDREAGSWKRSGNTLVLTPKESTMRGATTRNLAIVLQTTRSLTVDNGSQVRVFVKP